ncbi:MAG: FMN-binding protein [Clostridiales bacterium]|nr:FMN-binding protein [Clostridiales bacterium]
MKALRIAGVVLVALVCLIGLGFLTMSKQQQDALAKLQDVPVDMARVADGVYTAQSDGGMVKVEVQVTVRDHAIEDIRLLEHQNGLGKPAEAMLSEMIRLNTDQVDAVAGATASSLTIRNAVNRALGQGITP